MNKKRNLDRKQNLHNERASARSKSIRKRTRTSFLILMLLLSLYFVRGGITTVAADCLQQCQVNLANCLLAAQGDPIMEAQCQDNYDRCAENCNLR